MIDYLELLKFLKSESLEPTHAYNSEFLSFQSCLSAEKIFFSDEKILAVTVFIKTFKNVSESDARVNHSEVNWAHILGNYISALKGRDGVESLVITNVETLSYVKQFKFDYCICLPIEDDSLMLHRVMAYAALVNSLKVNKKFLLLDVDVILKQLPEIDEKINFGYRNHRLVMPINEGVQVGSKNEKVGSFYIRYAKMAYALSENQIIKKLYKNPRRWRCGQLALNVLLWPMTYVSNCEAFSFEGLAYNLYSHYYFNRDMNNYGLDSEGAFFLHYKGNAKASI